MAFEGLGIDYGDVCHAGLLWFPEHAAGDAR